MAEYIPKPEDAKSRTLVLLLDGTGNSLDNEWTNVAELKAMLYDQDENKQKVLYLAGLGTAAAGKFKTIVQKGLEMMVAINFADYVIEPYLWLAQNYRAGDKICIFGFSRGAYTARAVVGMIRSLGLLPSGLAYYAAAKETHTLYEKASKLPSAGVKSVVRDEAWKALEKEYVDFKRNCHMLEVFIEFLGCWDTVNSVGADRAIKLSYTRKNDIVRNMRHAVSLDEHRGRFKQNGWSGVAKEKGPDAEPLKCITNVEEVWFAGCHCDIGGGSVVNGTRPNLAHIPLRWMIRECFKTKCGLIFDSEKIKILGIEPSSIYPEVKPRLDVSSFSYGSAQIPVPEAEGWGSYLGGKAASVARKVLQLKPTPATLELAHKSEEDLDALDALAPAYDQIVLWPRTWNHLENRKEWVEKPTLDGREEFQEAHKGMGRTIPPPETLHGGKIKVHRTVRMRMESRLESGSDKGKKYVPLARVGIYEPYDQKTLFDKAVEKGWIEWVA